MLNAIKHRGPLRRVESIGTWKNGNITLGCLRHKGAKEEFARKHDSIVVMNGAFYRARRKLTQNVFFGE